VKYHVLAYLLTYLPILYSQNHSINFMVDFASVYISAPRIISLPEQRLWLWQTVVISWMLPLL